MKREIPKTETYKGIVIEYVLLTDENGNRFAGFVLSHDGSAFYNSSFCLGWRVAQKHAKRTIDEWGDLI